MHPREHQPPCCVSSIKTARSGGAVWHTRRSVWKSGGLLRSRMAYMPHVYHPFSGRQTHTKHSTICVKHIGQCTEYIAPEGYKSEGVVVPSTILQRILREYKNISKRIILTGNSSYIHIQTDARMATTSPGEVMATPWFSLHRSDKLGMIMWIVDLFFFYFTCN